MPHSYHPFPKNTENRPGTANCTIFLRMFSTSTSFSHSTISLLYSARSPVLHTQRAIPSTRRQHMLANWWGSGEKGCRHVAKHQTWPQKQDQWPYFHLLHHIRPAAHPFLLEVTEICLLWTQSCLEKEENALCQNRYLLRQRKQLTAYENIREHCKPNRDEFRNLWPQQILEMGKFGFETGSHFTVQAHLELGILLPQCQN